MTMKGNNVDYSVVGKNHTYIPFPSRTMSTNDVNPGQPKLDLDLYIQNYTG